MNKMARNALKYISVCALIPGIVMTQTPVMAAPLANAYKTTTQNNPIVTQRYSADPGVMVYNDEVYIYCSNDGDRADGYTSENTYGQINSVTCLSSKDLVNWTDHGTIAVAGRNGAAKWAANSWAPYAVHKKINGKDKFFLYFANNGSGIGVLTADSPTGPWTDPIGKALVTGATPNCSGVVWCFDPAAFVDSDGTGYLYFGGGVPTGQNANPKTVRGVKLGSDMTSLAGTPVIIDAPYVFEDSGINKIGNTYYYSYCSNWSTEGRMNAAAIQYMTSNSPLGPFTYKGEIFKNPGTFFNGSTGNNHHTLFNFKGNYYLAYHTRTLEQAALGKSLGYRSTHIDKVNINNGNISSITGTMNGVSQQGTLNPYERVEAETMANQAGVNTANSGASGNTVVTNINAGDWTAVKGVNFSDGVDQLTLSVKSTSTGSIKVCTDSPSGTQIGTISIPNTNGQFAEVKGTVSNVSGVKDLYFVFDGNMSFDYWKATGSTGVVTPPEETVKPNPNYATLNDGWYYIKNTGSQKYLQVKDNVAGNGVNVEIGTGTGIAGQKWQLVNKGEGYVTLKNGNGYMLDVANGKDENGTNIQTYEANNTNAQIFKILPTSQSNVYGIVLKCTIDTKGLDVVDKATTDGANVQEYFYYGAANQTWVFESCAAPGESNPDTPTNPEIPQTGDMVSIKVVSDWTDGATVEVTVTNLTGKDLNGWTCTFTTNRPITSLWSAKLVSQNGNTYTVSNPDWQPNLAAGASYTFGCNMGSGPANVTATNVSLK